MGGEELRRGLYQLQGRRFGKAAEVILKRLLTAEWSKKNVYDLKVLGQRVECKFTLARWPRKNRAITEKNFVEAVREAAGGTTHGEAVLFSDWSKSKFESMLNWVKPSEFDVMFYGVFFKDVLVVFRDDSSRLRESQGWYTRRRGMKDAYQGAMSMNHRNFGWHLAHRHYATVAYDDIVSRVTTPTGDYPLALAA